MKDDEYDDKSNNKDVCRLKFEIRHQEVFFFKHNSKQEIKKKIYKLCI